MGVFSGKVDKSCLEAAFQTRSPVAEMDKHRRKGELVTCPAAPGMFKHDLLCHLGTSFI